MLDLLAAVRPAAATEGASEAATPGGDIVSASPSLRPTDAAGDVELGAMPPAPPPTPAPHRARLLRLPRRSRRAAEDATPPPAEDASTPHAVDAEEHRRLFAAADEAGAGVAEVRAALQRLRALHASELEACRPAEIQELRRSMVADTAATSRAAQRVRAQIEALARRGCAPGSAAERMRDNLAVSLELRLRDAMADFAQLRAALRGDHEAVLARRYAAVAGRAPSAEEVRALEEAPHDAAAALLRRATATAGGAAPGLAEQVVEEVAARHDALLDLEGAMSQLTQMFLDLATLVDSQGDTVDSIESQVAKSAAYGERGRAAVASARRHQRAARRKALLVIVGALALAALVAVAIAVPAALRGK